VTRFFGLVASAAVAASVALAPPARAAAQDSSTVILLGTGTPNPDPHAQGPAAAVTVGSRIFLFDAGAGVERQLSAAGLHARTHPLTALFLTHLHSDHTIGLPDVILTTWVMGRKAPLRVVGPPGTRAMTGHLIAAWREDIDVRTRGLEHESPGGWAVDVRETRGGVVYDSAGVRIAAIPVKHGGWRYAFAYRVDAPDRTIVISGDTAPCEALEQAARGVDLLVHEVYPEVRLQAENRPGGDDWPRYMRSFHTSDRELGALCARARPKRLVLTHIVRMGGTDAELLAGVRAGGYDGPVSVGKDLDRY
jgi:ribonuclease BN (tRNA processing enzyme)